MKKVLKVVALVVVLMLGLQMCVHADMGAPMIKPYKAKVINPNGVECRDYQDNIVATLKYGDEIEIAYETSWSDEKYATFETEEHKNARINFKDIAPVEEMYVSKELKVDNPINRVVVAMEGAVLYKGPSLAYDKLGVVIPRGTEIVTYGEGLGDNPWFYTTYEGVSGWVCELGILGEYTDDIEIILSETEFTGLSKGEEIPED